MAKLYTQEAAAAYGNAGVGKAPADITQAKVKRLRGVFVSTGANNAAGDTIVIGRLPIGSRFMSGQLVGSVSSGTATIAIGTAAAPVKYRAATTQTTADAPVLFGKVAEVAGAALTAEEEVIATIGTAALPAGTYVFDILFSSAS